MNDPAPMRMTDAEIAEQTWRAHRSSSLCSTCCFMMIFAAMSVGIIIFSVSLAERKRDLAFDSALTKLCASYVRWTKLAHDHVEGMDRRCNLGAKE